MKDFCITDENKLIDKRAWRELIEYVRSMSGKNITVFVSSFTDKRSSAQLRGYWSLISQIQRPINLSGNNYSQEEISDMLKLRYFYKEVLGEKIPRSIAKKSDCSKEDMRYFLENILFWCNECGFKAEITSDEMSNLINQYKE